MKSFIIAATMLFLLAACTTPQMLLNQQLAQQSTAMPVSGRQGLLINQKIQFGDYQSEKVKRSWTRSYGWDVFLANLEDAREKYSFTLFDGNRGAYTVHAANHIKGVEIPLGRFLGPNTSAAVRELASFTLQTQDLFAASLYSNARQEAWHLTLMNRIDTRKNGKYAGLLTHESEQTIEVVPIRELAGKSSWGNEIAGYEFRQEGKTLAAVEVLNKGRVWINPQLDDNMKLVLATASATLLLQQDLELPSESVSN